VPDLEVKEGRRLKPEDLGAMLLSPDFADQLGVEEDDPLVVTATTVDGLLNTRNVEVVGLYSPLGIGGRIVIAPVSFIQMVRHTDRFASIAVKLADQHATGEVALRLQRTLEDNDLPGLKVRTWMELADFYHQVGLFLDSIFGFVSLVIFLLVFFSVLEGLTMAFFERIREVGTVRAIGTKRCEIFGVFLSEGVFLGFFSGLAGVALGWGIGGLINIAGLTWISPIGGVQMPFRITLGLGIASMPFLVALGATAISAIYPAYQAAKLEIANALRFV
jgi:putative ABC transport system permease protein